MAKIPAERRGAHDESRRKQIAEAALQVWLRDGYHDAPVEAIAREAGLGKGTISLYFATKEAVLQAVVERFSLLPAIEELLGKLREIPPEQAVPLLIATVWQRLRERGPLFALLLGGGAVRSDNGRGFIERGVIPRNRLLPQYLDHCVDRRALRPMDTFVAALALVARLVMFIVSPDVL